MAIERIMTFEDVAVTTGYTTLAGVEVPAGAKARIKGFGIAFSGVAGDGVPVDVRTSRSVLDGTSTTGVANETSTNDNGVAVVGSPQHTYTAEPTTILTLHQFKVHPQGAWDKDMAFLNVEIVGEAFTILAKAPAAVNASGYIIYED